MSPADQLADQATAQAFADECLRAMLTANRLPEDDEDADAILTSSAHRGREAPPRDSHQGDAAQKLDGDAGVDA